MASTSLVIRDYKKEIPGHLSEDKKSFLFPVITSINSHKKKTEWRIVAKLFKGNIIDDLKEEDFIGILDDYFENKPMEEDISGWIKVYSKAGENGKIRDSIPTVIKEGKSKGKSNETNVFCQTLRDAFSLHNKQLKKAVSEQKNIGETVRYPPMLAQLFGDNVANIKFDPANIIFVQRKYNGVRAVATLDTVNNDKVVIMYSRKKHLYPGFSYIKNELKQILQFYEEAGQQLYIDGELYLHGRALQDISGYARREEKHENNDQKLNYMIYDVFDPAQPNLNYEQRKQILDEIFENFPVEHCKLVETFQATNYEEINNLYLQFIDEGYEGAMVRLNEPYRYSHNDYHCKVLLKMKPTLDGEFEIVGYESGTRGKALNALMIICKTDAGIEFPVTPAMELPDRIKLFKKMGEIDPTNNKEYFENVWKGHKIIVYFDEFSKDQVPLRARTKLEIRDVVE